MSTAFHPAAREIEVVVNGAPRTVADGASVAALLDALGLAGKRVAVEVNREIVPRSRHGAHALAPGDRLEIIHAIGGG
jgi:sulfur carrier protein